VVIGSGPAGFTAAIYAARANLRPLVFEGYQKGGVPGGQLMTTTEVENFPGFPEGITGPELMERMREQATRWGATTLVEDVEEVDVEARPMVIRGTETTVRAHSIIVATGATARRLGIPSEEKFWSNGISACAICDGASPIFKGQEVAVVGGGDTALEEAVYLTKYASKVHLLVRGSMRASKAMQERVTKNANIEVHLNTQVEDAFGDLKGKMAGLRLVDSVSGEKRDLAVRGLFYGIGHTPNSDFLGGALELDAEGYVVVGPGGSTRVPGVFAAGDLHDVHWRQAITAAGAGCQAALNAERYLVGENLAVEYAGGAEETSTSEREAREEGKAAAAAEESAEAGYNPDTHRHKGQYALRKLYHESDRILAVLYTSPTCGPCKALKPMFAKVLDEYPDDIDYVEIDIVQDQEMAEAGGVTGTPTVQLFYEKELKHHLPGVKMKSDYRKLFNEILEEAGKKVPETAQA